MAFKGSMHAKEFLVSRIAAEAQRAQVPLSELEQKELYFSENYPTLPNMLEIDEQFEAQVDSGEFEEKIRKLSRQAFSHDSMESPEIAERWRDAIRRLEDEDHYILVVLDLPRQASDVAKLFAAGNAVTVTGVAAVAALNWAGGNGLSRIPDRIK